MKTPDTSDSPQEREIAALRSRIADLEEQLAQQQRLVEHAEEPINDIRLMRMFLEHTPDAISVIRVDPATNRRKLVMCNEQYVQMVGRPRKEMMRDEDYSDVRGNELIEASPEAEKRMKQGLPRQAVGYRRDADGNEVYEEWAVTPVRMDGWEYLLCVERNVTARERKTREVALNEQFLRTVLDSTQDGISIIRVDADTDGRGLVFCNNRYCEMAGRSREYLMADQNFTKLGHDLEKPENIEQLRRDRLPRRGVSVWNRPDGTELLHEWIITPVVQNGQEYLISIQRDVTEKRQQAQQLARDEQMLRSMMEHSHDGFTLRRFNYETSEQTLIMCNKRLAELAGRSREELLAMGNIRHLITLVDEPVDLDRLQRERLPRSGVATWDRPDGKLVYDEWTAASLVLDGEDYIFSVHRDVTEQRKAAEELARSEQLLRSMMEHSHDGFSLDRFDYDTGARKLILCNTRFAEMLGRSREELLEMGSLESLIDRLEIPEDIEHLQRERLPRTGLAIWTMPDGTQIHDEWTASSIVIKGEEYIFYVHRDVTEQRKAARELVRSEKLLRAIMEHSYDGVSLAHIDPVTGARQMIMCNDRLLAISGRTREELAAPNAIYDFVTQRELPVDLDERRENRLPRQGVCSWDRPDGLENFDEWTAAPVVLEGKDYLVCIDRDITHRAWAERALRESEESFRALSEQSLLGVAIVQDERIRYVNRAMCELVEYSIGEILSWKADGPDPANDPSERTSVLNQILHMHQIATNTASHFTSRLATKTGQLKWVEYYARQIDYQGAKAVFLTLVDITARQKAEMDLRGSERRFREVLEASRDVIYRLNLKTLTYDYISPSSEKLLGYTSDEMVAMGFAEAITHIYPDDQERLKEHLASLLNDRDNNSTDSVIEYRWRHKTRGWDWFSDNRAFVLNEAGQPTAIVGTVRRITEQKQSERVLKESEEKYRTVTENSDLAICMLTERGEYRFANSSLAEYLQLQPDELVGQSLQDTLPADIAAELTDTLATVIQTDKGVTLERLIPLPAGPRWFYINIHPFFDPIRQSMLATLLAADVTERKQAEEQLRRSEARFRAIFESTDDCVLVLDRDYNYLYANQAAIDHVGTTRENVIDKNFRDALAHIPDFMHLWMSRVDEVFATNKRMRVADHVPVGDQLVWSESSLSPIRDPQGNVFAVGIVYRDVTRREQAQQALQAAHRKLMNAREEERRHLARELHDSLGQNLIAMKLALQGVASDAEQSLTDEQTAILDETAERCSSLVREVRSICHGLFPRTLESLGLHAAMQGLRRDFEPNMAVLLDVADQLTDARFDEDVEIALFRIAQEATYNAYRHGKAGNVNLCLDSDNGTLSLTITDNGCGFDVSSVNEQGLGLRTMQDRATAVGGEFTIQSQPGRTEVTLHVAATPRGVDDE